MKTDYGAVHVDVNMLLNTFYSSQTHAEVTLAKADAALRQKEGELASLRAEHQTLTVELTAVKQGLSTSAERVERLHDEGQVGERADTSRTAEPVNLSLLLLFQQVSCGLFKM